MPLTIAGWCMRAPATSAGDLFDGPPQDAPWAPPDLGGDVVYFTDEGASVSLWRAGLP